MRLVLTTEPRDERTAPPAGDLPWGLSDVKGLIRVTLATLFVVIGCFAGARNSGIYDDELYWLVAAIAAMLVACYTWTTWYLTGARALRQRQRAFEVAAREVVAELRPAPLDAPGVELDVEVIGRFVTAAGMTRFHAPDCMLVRGRPLQVVDAGAAGLEPCGVCLR